MGRKDKSKNITVKCVFNDENEFSQVIEEFVYLLIINEMQRLEN